MPVGSVAQVIDTMDGWARITTNGKTGWMDMNYLRMQDSGDPDTSGGADGTNADGDMITITLPRSAAEALLAALGGVLGWG